MTGIFCDECAPGYDTAFPACKECHPCNAFWTDDIRDVERAAQIMRTFIPVPGPDVQPGGNPHLQRMLEMHSQLDELANLTGLSPPKVAKLEKMLAKMRFVLQLSHSGPGSLRLNCSQILYYRPPLSALSECLVWAICTLVATDCSCRASEINRSRHRNGREEEKSDVLCQ